MLCALACIVARAAAFALIARPPRVGRGGEHPARDSIVVVRSSATCVNVLPLQPALTLQLRRGRVPARRHPRQRFPHPLSAGHRLRCGHYRHLGVADPGRAGQPTRGRAVRRPVRTDRCRHQLPADSDGRDRLHRARRPYSYDDLPRGQTDPHLRHFSIAHDEPYIIPALHQALARNPSLTMLANPWSVPGWMKANDALDNQHHSGLLLHTRARAVRPVLRQVPAGVRGGRHPDRRDHPAERARQRDPSTPAWSSPPTARPGSSASWLKPALSAAGLNIRDLRQRPGMESGRSGVQPTLGSSAQRRSISGFAWHCYFGSPLTMDAQHARRRSGTRSSTSARPGSSRSRSPRC